ncbi:hypothetical protein PILCRDRAFT_816605 [Piloderma croceum F 1598]|uniref:Cytochrome P450 monooxygenase pc-3 n=1 Tax=Piloderma croceum (strain F 1598) TaxID=765440 RepID=A0A0C3C8N0_PILCF|nr:hypothetical protein PILCRDRAFT_816605 [Piloderma croceum F 1598]
MAFLTPGAIFLSRCLVSLLLPSAVIAGTRFILKTQFDIFIPIWALVTGGALGIPVVIIAQLVWAEIYQRRRAAALGARFVPRVVGRWPGNIDVLIDAIEKMRNSYPADGQWDLMKHYGTTYNFYLTWEDTIMTYDPDNIKTILVNDFPNYVKGGKFRKAMASVLGTGVFNSDGEMWKFHRSMTRPFFVKDVTSDFDKFDRHADIAVEKMKERSRAGYAIDFQDVISRFTLDSATEFLFGKNVDSLADDLPYPHGVAASHKMHSSPAEQFSKAFTHAQYIVSERSKLGWIWPLLEIFEDRTKEPMKVVDSFLEPLVQYAIEKHDSDDVKEKDEHSETLLDHLVKLTTDRNVLKDELLNILLAGRDTTASTLTSVIYLLAINPTVLDRLREEILTCVGTSAKPTYDDIREMKYLRAVLNETLRLFPPVPFDVRQTVHETTWPSKDPTEKPMYIPAGTNTAYAVFIMHRRTDLWGPDALEFDPDRFLDERAQKYLVHNPFIFVPFNAGPRICLGQQFAYNEMSYMLIRILQNFSTITLDIDAQSPETRVPASWAKVPGRQSIERFWPKVHLTMYAHGGLWVKMNLAGYT